MSDPLRLSKTLDAHGQKILAAVDDDAPTPRSKDALLATLGLGASTAAGIGAGALAAKGAKAAAISSWWASPLAKVAVVVGASTIVASGAVAVHVQTESNPQEPRAAAPTATTRPATSFAPSFEPARAPALPPAAEPAAPPSAEATVDVVVLPRAPTVVAKATTRSSPPATGDVVPPHESPEHAPAPAQPQAPRARSTVREELTLLDETRARLASGDARAALERLDEHRRRYPSAVLSHEATTMRIDALVTLGRPAEAASIAKAFLEINPDSAQAPRIRKMIDATSNR